MSTPTAHSRLRIGVVGAGRAGTVLGAALTRAGHRVVAVSAVSDISRARAQVLLPGVGFVPDEQVPADADLVLLAVPEDQLAGVVAGLAAAGAWQPGQILVHTSPGHGIGILEPAMSGVGPGPDVLPLALHPCVALTGGPADLDRLTGAVFAVTTLRSLRPLGEALVLEMGGEPVWVEEEDRPAYAAALAAVRDQLGAVLGAAGQMLADCGIPDPRRALAGLVTALAEDPPWTGSVAATGATPLPRAPEEPRADPEEPP